MEEGSQMLHRHVQGVIRVMSTAANVVSRAIRKFLDWDSDNAPPGALVMCKCVTL